MRTVEGSGIGLPTSLAVGREREGWRDPKREAERRLSFSYHHTQLSLSSGQVNILWTPVCRHGAGRSKISRENTYYFKRNY